MLLTIRDGILYARDVPIEKITTSQIIAYFYTCGYRPSTAQAIAYGVLSDRAQTIALAQLVKLLSISLNDDIRNIDRL
jgi:hypothetical protein